MCIMNNRPPTEKEKQKLKTGYKVFKTQINPNYDDKMIYGLFSPFRETEISQIEWNTATPARFSEDSGFHLFKYKCDAQTYKKCLKEWNKHKLVVLKVEIDEILQIGQIREGYCGEEIDRPNSVIQANKIKIWKNPRCQ